MNDDELRNMWKGSQPPELVQIEQTTLLNDLSYKLGKFDKQIEKRNLRENFLAIALIILFGFIAYSIPYTLTKIACLLMIPYYLFYMYKIRSVRNQKTGDLSRPPRQFLINQKEYLQKEKKLLDDILYWAILPFVPVIVLFYAGFPMDLQSYLIYGSITFVILAAVYGANKYAVKHAFIPLLNKVDGMIREFDKQEHSAD